MEKLPTMPPAPEGESSVMNREEFYVALQFPEESSVDLNNFYIHFLPGTMHGDIYRSQSHFKELFEGDPDLVARLDCAIKGSREQGSLGVALVQCKDDLYDAYVLMRDSGASDKDIF